MSAAADRSGPDEVAWLLASPGVSDWVKAALRAAEGRDPVALLNDLELLAFVLRPRAEAEVRRRIEAALASAGGSPAAGPAPGRLPVGA